MAIETRGMRELALFSGAGGGLLASHAFLQTRPVGYVEYDDYCQQVTARRIKDGILPNAPIYGDIRTFIAEGYARRHRGMVDLLTGGFPCQPFSSAGKRAGADDPRNMWPATLEAIRIIRPPFCLLENVRGLLSARLTFCSKCGGRERGTITPLAIRENEGEREVLDDVERYAFCEGCGEILDDTTEDAFWYFGTILGDLAESGYDAQWRVLSAAELGAPHRRDRLWIVAHNTRP